MRAETMVAMMESGDYDNLTCAEFAAIYREQMNALVEDERYAKQLARARDILAEMEEMDND